MTNGPSNAKRGFVLAGNVLLILLGVALLVVHVAFLAEGHPTDNDVGRFGAALRLVPTLLVGVPLVVAGFCRRSVPRALRRIELAVAASLIVATATEWI